MQLKDKRPVITKSGEKIYYKIVEWRGGEDYRFLYHGIDGERRIPINRWIDANIKENARDGGGSRRYTSGIHLFDNWTDAYNYCARFNSEVGGKKRNTTIVKCLASGIRKKEHSKSNVFLANRIKVIL